jgi:hypothetical protein
MKRDRFRSASLAAIVPFLATALWSSDPEIGTWKLNIQKSRFLPGPGFRSETRTYEEQQGGVKVTIRTVDGKGREATSVYLTTPDGQQHVVSGSGGPADSVGLKRINEYTAESTLMHAGREIAKTTRTMEPEGKRMIITYRGLDPDGTPVDYTLVFDRLK